MLQILPAFLIDAKSFVAVNVYITVIEFQKKDLPLGRCTAFLLWNHRYLFYRLQLLTSSFSGKHISNDDLELIELFSSIIVISCVGRSNRPHCVRRKKIFKKIFETFCKIIWKRQRTFLRPLHTNASAELQKKWSVEPSTCRNNNRSRNRSQPMDWLLPPSFTNIP